MQRRLPEGIVIACDFCGTDWDEVLPMIEGHQGSVICLPCLDKALAQQSGGEHDVKCSMCLREVSAARPHWSPTPPPPQGNPQAVICDDCINQAARAFDKDPDVDWKRPR
jgi:hypothetical protein